MTCVCVSWLVMRSNVDDRKEIAIHIPALAHRVVRLVVLFPVVEPSRPPLSQLLEHLTAIFHTASVTDDSHPQRTALALAYQRELLEDLPCSEEWVHLGHAPDQPDEQIHHHRGLAHSVGRSEHPNLDISLFRIHVLERKDCFLLSDVWYEVPTWAVVR